MHEKDFLLRAMDLSLQHNLEMLKLPRLAVPLSSFEVW